MATTTDPRTTNGPARLDTRSTGELLADISSDVVSLVRQQVELAKMEITEALGARLVALTVALVAAVLVLLVLVFTGLAASRALAYAIPMWAARLTVAAVFGGAALLSLPLVAGLRRRHELKPTETLRTVGEGIEWAKERLAR